MKRLFPLIFLFALACSKTLDTIPETTATDLHHKSDVNDGKPKLVYTQYYTGPADASFTATFPPFDPTLGNLVSWRVDVLRRVYGTTTLTNTLDSKNNSPINILRYSLFNVDTAYGTIPQNIVKQLRNDLHRNETQTLNLDFKIRDTVNSVDYQNFLNAIQTPDIVVVVRDLVNTFKPNCINSDNLQDSTTLTLTYTFTNN